MNAFASEGQAHWLRPLKTTRLPNSLLFLACDWQEVKTDGADPRRMLLLKRLCGRRVSWHTYTWTHRGTWTAETPTDARECIYRDLVGMERTWVIGHHMSIILELIDWWREIDRGNVLPPTLHEKREVLGDDGEIPRDPMLSPCVLSDPPLIVGATWRHKRALFLDVRNYSDQLSSDLDYVQVRREEFDYEPEGPAEEYPSQASSCVYLLTRTITRWIDAQRDNNLGSWGPTSASVAWNTFRRRYLPARKLLVHRDWHALTYERWAYCQGSTLLNFQGLATERAPVVAPLPDVIVNHVTHAEGGVSVLDVSSQYPALLSHEPVPIRLLGRTDGDRQLSKTIPRSDRVVMIHGLIRTDDPIYPCRVTRDTLTPVIGRMSESVEDYASPDNTVIYPVGEFEVVLIGEDAKNAVLNDHFTAIYQWWEYAADVIGEQWLADLWLLRTQCRNSGDNVGEQWVKSLLNGVLGKFAAHTQRWDRCPSVPAPFDWGQWLGWDATTDQIERYRAIGGAVEIASRRMEHADSMPAVAATITAASRWQMRRLRDCVGESNWYYQGVDSLHVAAEASHHLPNWVELGIRRPGEPSERARYKEALWLGRTTYCLEGQWTVSGIAAGSRWADGPYLHGRRKDRASTLLSRPPGAGVYVSDWVRDLRRCDVGGRVGDDGWVTPWEV